MKIKFSNVLIVIGVALALFMALGFISSISNDNIDTSTEAIEGTEDSSDETSIEPSNEISFTVNDETYTVSDGMTWSEWLNADGANTGYYVNSDGYVYFTYQVLTVNGQEVCGDDVIISGANYVFG